jgi:GNAT superfamily N-acetyltransferase
VNIRDAVRGEDTAIQALVRDVLAEFELEFDLAGQDGDLLDLRSNYVDRGGCFKVIEEEGRPIACAGLFRLSPDEGELRKMYVRREARGRGLGRALLNNILAEARSRGLKRITLESHSILTTARALYESAGFVPVAHPHPSYRADVAMELFLR